MTTALIANSTHARIASLAAKLEAFGKTLPPSERELLGRFLASPFFLNEQLEPWELEQDWGGGHERDVEPTKV